MGIVAALRGYKTAVTITWKYAAGEQSIGGFKETFEKGGGKVLKELFVPFPNVEFQALLTEIASIKPTCAYAFFAGGGAVKFVKDYAAAGLKEKVPLLGAGFLTDGTLDAQGAVRRRAAHHAALRRQSDDAAQQRIPARLRQGLQHQGRRLRRAGLRFGAAPRPRIACRRR